MLKKSYNLPPAPLEVTNLEDGVAVNRAAPSTDCRCEMRVTQADGAGTYPNDNWSIADDTGGVTNGTEIAGNGDDYYIGTNNFNLPSDWRELNDPSDGNHDFTVSYVPAGTSNAANFILRTEVRCFEIDGGVETLATTTYHNFDLDQRDNYTVLAGVHFSEFCRKFSCEVLAAGEDSCRD